jgi:hypothetical protein
MLPIHFGSDSFSAAEELTAVRLLAYVGNLDVAFL